MAKTNMKNRLRQDSMLESTTDKSTETTVEEYRRQTYYLTAELKDAIDYMAFAERKEKSEVVRELLKKALDPKYFNRP